MVDASEKAGARPVAALAPPADGTTRSPFPAAALAATARG